MKSITKKIAVVLLVCLLAVSVIALIACDKDPVNPGVYTVKVVDASGNPYTAALVQLCKIESSGSLSTCYEGVKTDAQGVAKLTIGTEIPDKDVDYVEVHLLGLPSYLTYDAVKMHKNETVTVTVKQGTLATPKSGNGTGSYLESLGEITNQINDETFKPYVVEEGAYAFKFTAATQKIYFEFRGEEGVYKVYSVGAVDAKVVHLQGTLNGGIRYYDEDEFISDNVSSTDKNFSYQFEVSPELIEQTQAGNESITYGAVYFEVALANSADVNKDSIIVFEYVKKYEPPKELDTVDVKPAKNLTAYSNPVGSYFIEADLDGSVNYVLGDDGYYHIDSKDGVLLIATLGKGGVTPQGLELAFLDIYAQGQPFTFQDGDVYKNYYPLVKAYVDASNEEGRYPLTDELIEFFNKYIEVAMGGPSFLEEALNTHLPEGEEWLAWCGFYYEAPLPEGTEDDPFMLTEGELTVSVAEGGKVYYSIMPFGDVTIDISSSATNVKIEAYSSYDKDQVTTAQSTAGGISCTVEVGMFDYYFFVFSTLDGKAASFTIEVAVEYAPEPDGSSEYPYELYFGTTYGETTELNWENQPEPTFYKYVVEEEVDMLYFYLGENTLIADVTVIGEDAIPHSYTFDQLKDGLAVSTGDVVTIMASTAEGIGSFEFSVYKDPLGSKENAHMIEDGESDVDVPADGEVYYAYNSFFGPNAKITIKSTSTNVKLLAYASSSDVTPTPVLSTADGFTFTIETESMELYYFVFSTADGKAGQYTIEVEIEYLIPEGDS